MICFLSVIPLIHPFHGYLASGVLCSIFSYNTLVSFYRLANDSHCDLVSLSFVLELYVKDLNWTDFASS